MSTTERMSREHLSSIPRIDTGVVRVMLNFGFSVLRALRNRQALNRLNALEDYQLQDIGLTRGDLDRAVNFSGLFDDPFKLLPSDAQLRGRRVAAMPRRF